MSQNNPGLLSSYDKLQRHVIPTDPTDSAHNGEPPAAVNEAAPLNAADCMRLLDALLRSRVRNGSHVAIVVADELDEPLMIEYRNAGESLAFARRYHGHTLQEAITALAAGERMRT